MSQAEGSLSISPENIFFHVDSQFILQPHYVDEARTRIKGIVRSPSGELREMTVEKSDTNSPFIRDVFAQYGEAELELFTHKQRCLEQRRREFEKRWKEDAEREAAQEALFRAKQKALAIPAIRDHADQDAVKRLRRAANDFEVLAIAVALMQRKGE